MIAVSLRGVSKRYNIYDRPIDRLREMLVPNGKRYHKEFWSLQGINLDFEAGKTTAVIGPNGSGKSTLLQVIAKVITPTHGQVQICGRVSAILELGAGFQPDYTGRENIIVNGMILGISREEMMARMNSIAEFAEIGDFFDQPVKTYSSGMVVRLAFATAITVDPDILLVDEALAVGDVNFQIKCFKKIDALQSQGKTIILVTHNMEAVKNQCHDAVLLNGGRIIDKGTQNEMIPRYLALMENTGAIAPKVFTPA